MQLLLIRNPQKVCLFAFFSATLGFATASAQEEGPLIGDEYLAGDVPEWIEESGFDDTHGNPSESQVETESTEGASERGMPRASGCPKRKCNCLHCRDKLTGDWHGLRTILKEEGIGYRGRVTQFFFGVGGGVNPPVPAQFESLGIGGGDTFEYTGNSRHDFLFDMEKFGGLPHSKFLFTMENLWGRWGNVSFETGALAPSVFNSVMPVDTAATGDLYCTNFMFLQPLSEQLILSAGKTRTIGIADNNKFAGGDGSDQFLNQTFVANPLMVPMIPLSTFVVGAAMPQEWGNIGFSVMDTKERSTEFMEFGSLFAEGAIVSSQILVNTNFFDLPGEQHVGGFYKNADQTDLTFTPLPPTYPYAPAPPNFQTRSESYTLFYGFDQYLVTYGPADKRGNAEGWGLFGRASIADDARGNPNWAAWFVSLGIGGSSPLRSRRGKGDRFGVGFGYTAASSEFGAIPQFLFAPRDAQNIEMYYRYKITPAIEFTPDVQWVNGMLGGLTGGDGAIVAGIRLNMIL